MDRGAWWATVHGVAKSRTRLSDITHSLYVGQSDFYTQTHTYERLHSVSYGKESTCNVDDPGLILGREDPLEEGMAAHSSILA